MLNDCPFAATGVFIAYAAVRRGGEVEVTLVVLGVCAMHRDTVQLWFARRALSEGIWVPVEDEADVDRLSLVAGRRTDSETISNVEGPVLVA